MKRIALFILVALFATESALWACSGHPTTISHEEWTSAIRDQRDKNTGALLTATKDFWNKNRPEAVTNSNQPKKMSSGNYSKDRKSRVRRVR